MKRGTAMKVLSCFLLSVAVVAIGIFFLISRRKFIISKLQDKRIQGLENFLKKFPDQKKLLGTINKYLSEKSEILTARKFYGKHDYYRKWEKMVLEQEEIEIRKAAKEIRMSNGQIDVLMSKLKFCSHFTEWLTSIA